MGYPKFTVSNQKEESISLLKGLYFTTTNLFSSVSMKLCTFSMMGALPRNSRILRYANATQIFHISALTR